MAICAFNDRNFTHISIYCLIFYKIEEIMSYSHSKGLLFKVFFVFLYSIDSQEIFTSKSLDSGIELQHIDNMLTKHENT